MNLLPTRGKKYLQILLDYAGSLIVASFVVFAIVQFVPGDIASIHNLSNETATSLGLDKPFFLRYLSWLWGSVQFDFGISLARGEEVSLLLAKYGSTTMVLTFGSVLLSLILAIPIGAFLGMNPHSKWAKVISLAIYSISSVPVFVLGYIVLAVVFKVFNFYSPSPPEGPFSFWPWFSYYVIPVLVLSIGNGTLGEFVRFIDLETRTIDGSLYIRAVRARGTPLFRHFIRSMILPIFNILTANIAVLLGGVVVVERIFNRHGLGWLSWEATLQRDFSVVMAITLLMAFIVRSFMLLNQLSSPWLDPRLRT